MTYGPIWFHRSSFLRLAQPTLAYTSLQRSTWVHKSLGASWEPLSCSRFFFMRQGLSLATAGKAGQARHLLEPTHLQQISGRSSFLTLRRRPPDHTHSTFTDFLDQAVMGKSLSRLLHHLQEIPSRNQIGEELLLWCQRTGKREHSDRTRTQAHFMRLGSYLVV